MVILKIIEICKKHRLDLTWVRMCAKFSTIVITNNDLARGVRDLWITIQSHCLRFARFATFSWIFIFAYVVVNVLALSRIMFVLAEIRTPCFRTIVLHGYEFMLNLNKNCWSYYSFLGSHVLLVTRYTTSRMTKLIEISETLVCPV